MPITSSEQRILEQLRLGREEMPNWGEVLDLQIAILEVQMEADLPVAPGVPDAEEATRRRRAGVPLVTGRELALDWKAFAALYTRVCEIGASHRSDLADEFEKLKKMASDRELLAAWVIQFMTESQLAGDDDASGLRAFVLTHTLRPFLRRYAEACTSLVDESGWRRGYCPVCGGEPDLASLGGPHDRGEGTRFLLCSRCDYEWPYPRVGCPYCENKDHASISYYSEAEGPHRLYVCQLCKRYLKTVDVRAAPGRVLLPVERILTIGMDVMARESGYH
jgi:FdhE protein